MSFLAKIFGDSNLKTLKTFEPLVEKINSLENSVSALSNEELKNKTSEFRKALESGKTTDEILPEAFAVAREAAKRTLGQRHFDVQLLGGVALHRGSIAEMKTGEGKTLVATLPAYLNALDGKGVHIVTVNDYLSRRDAVWMGQIYYALGLSVGVINHEESFIYDPAHTEKDKERDELGSFKVVHEFLRPCSRREAYEADITYGTNNEYGFDYLRDNIEYDVSRLRQRGYNYAIVDEIDSILIDESRTPLIISAPTAESESLYKNFAKVAEGMKEDEHYKVDEKLKAITVTDAGIDYAESKLGIKNIYGEGDAKTIHHLETAVRAKALFHLDKDYVVKDGQIVIVDEFTGRLQPGRRWSEGLHQAIEAKEGVEIQKETRTFASITFQNFFRMYKKLSGMTGTALTSKEEFYKVYGLDVVAIPSNKPIARSDRNDFIFQTEKGKFKAIATKIKEINKKGQPVLVGTVSIEKNELLSKYLTVEGVKHEILNAKNHEREGEIVAQAGRKNAVTIATNMAGRGVDIKLGGNPATEAEYEEVKNLGGLFVIGTERHEARRIDNQLRGRSGRQGDPGETQFFVSLEDSLMRIFATDTLKNMMGRFGIPEDQPIENYLITRSLESAQTKIEGFNFDARKHVLEYDDVLNHQRKTVYERRKKILAGTEEEVKEKLEEVLAGAPEIKKVAEQKKSEAGESQFYKTVRLLLLQITDMFWVEHLEAMDYLRGSVNLRAYGQRDPLVEYKKEGLKLFKEMQENIDAEILKILPNLNFGGLNVAAVTPDQKKLKEVHEEALIISGGDGSNKAAGESGAKPANGSVVAAERIGRNDPCPCGAKKSDGTPVKYKNCHGK